jgi:hypothetical protein
LAAWSLPALRFFSSPFSPNDLPCHAAFFSAHGSTIETLEMKGGSTHLLLIAVTSCPLLESLSVDIIYFSQPLPPLPKLRQLRLDVSNASLSLLEGVFNNVSNVHLGVTSIQLTSISFSEFARLAKGLHLLNEWKRWDEICSQRDIRFEDLDEKMIHLDRGRG